MTNRRWNKPGIPHTDWECLYVIDLKREGGYPGICKMCDNTPIRYLHIMKHPVYAEEIGVGCVCAGKMTDDPEGARRRENVLRNEARRYQAAEQREKAMHDMRAAMTDEELAEYDRDLWISTLTWKVSQKGNLYTDRKGQHLVVFQRDDELGYKCVIDGDYADGTFGTVEAAQGELYNICHGLSEVRKSVKWEGKQGEEEALSDRIEAMTLEERLTEGRQAWLDQTWSISKAGHHHIFYRGRHMLIFKYKKSSEWGFYIDLPGNKKDWSDTKYESREEAKVGLFDKIHGIAISKVVTENKDQWWRVV